MNSMKIRNDEVLFLGSYSIYLTYYILKQTAYNRFIPGYLDKLVPLICICVFVLLETYFSKRIFTNYVVLAIIAVMALLAVKNSVGATRNTLILMMLFVLYSVRIDYKKIAYITVAISSILLFIIIFNTLVLEILPNYLVGSDRGFRNSLGFLYPLYPASILFNIIVSLCIVRGEKLSFTEIILLQGINYWLFYMTKSRLSYYLICLLLIISLVYKLAHKYIIRIIESLALIRIALMGSFAIGTVLSMILVVLYRRNPSGIMSKINSVLSDRLYYSNLAIDTYGINLFGKRIRWIGGAFNDGGIQQVEEYLYVDNLYLQILQQYGIIFAGILLATITATLIYMIRHKMYYSSTIMAIVAIRCIIDDASINLHYNSLLLLSAPILNEEFFKNARFDVYGNKLGGMILEHSKNRVIYLRELIWYVIFQWKKIISLGIVFAILLGGIKYVKDIKDVESKAEEVVVSTSGLSELEIATVYLTEGFYQKYKFYDLYNEESIKMKLNPNKVKICKVKFYVDSDYQFNYTADNETDYTESLSLMYTYGFDNTEFAEYLIEKCKIDSSPQYVQELVKADYKKNIVSLEIMLPDDIDEELIKKCVEDYANKISEQIAKYGAHTIVVLSNDIVVTYSRELESHIYDIKKLISDFGSQYYTNKTSLSNAQLKLLDGLIKQNNSYNVSQKEEAKAILSKKYVVLGFVFGCFILCLYYVVAYVLSSKLKYYKDIHDIHDIYLLKRINMKSAKKGPVTELLMKLKNKGIKKLSYEEQINDLCEYIAMYADDNDVKKIGFISTKSIDDELKNAFNAISKSFECVYGQPVIDNAVSLRNYKDCDAVIIVEQIDKSSYNELQQEIDILNANNIKIIGSVVLEN